MRALVITRPGGPRALVITEHGPPEVLKVQERPDPSPGAGEVRVRVKAGGINFADLMARAGLYPDAPKLPSVVGYEIAGDVEAVGAGVDRVAAGRARDRRHAASAATPSSWPAGDRRCCRCPTDWSFEEGAALPVVYATAYAGSSATARCSRASEC